MSTTKQQIAVEIARLQGPCHQAFRAGRDARIAQLQKAIETAPESIVAEVKDEAYEKWLRIQKTEARIEATSAHVLANGRR